MNFPFAISINDLGLLYFHIMKSFVAMTCFVESTYGRCAVSYPQRPSRIFYLICQYQLEKHCFSFTIFISAYPVYLCLREDKDSYKGESILALEGLNLSYFVQDAFLKGITYILTQIYVS